MWKENCFGWPLRGIIWFTVVIVGSCALTPFSPDTFRQPDRRKKSPTVWKRRIRVEMNHCPLGLTLQVSFLIPTPAVNFMDR
jgi:hypothetical protein